MTVSILKPQFGSTMQLAVELAWGANPQSNMSGWTWTDITTDVLMSGTNAISFTRGGSDETSVATAASLTLELKNNTSKYSQTALSPNYPNVRRNTPIRIRLIQSAVSHTRFFGYVTSWTPTYALKGNDARVVLVANGALQRITQSNQQIGSVMTRGISSLTTNPPIAYWPCEDASNATSLASGISNCPTMDITLTGQPLGSYSNFACSKPILTFDKSSGHGRIKAYTLPSPNAIQVTFLLNAPGDSGCIDGSALFEIHTWSGQPLWMLRWHNFGTLSLENWDYWGNKFNTFGPFSMGAIVLDTVVRLQLQQTATDTVSYEIDCYNVDTQVVLTASGSWVGSGGSPRLNMSESVHVNGYQENSSMSFGHIFVQAANDPIGTLANYYLAYKGEDPASRMTRLASEQGEVITITGTSSIDQGSQLPMSYLYLLQEGAFTEQGILADGINQGPTYYVREIATAQPVSMTLDLSKGQVANFVPVDDDKLNANKFQAQRPNGGSLEVDDITGPFGQNAIGQYVYTGTFNRYNDHELADCAYWMINKGTKFGPDNVTAVRYPSVPVVLEKNPGLAGQVFNTDILKRIDITNANTILPQVPAGRVISLAVQGYTETISATEWHVTYNCCPYDIYRVAVFAADTGDTGEFVGRFESDGVTVLTATASIGATTLSVNTPTGPTWTTAADDFPFVINVLDIPVTVTAISVASGTTQTFTVTGSTVTKSLASGALVKLWNNPVMEL